MGSKTIYVSGMHCVSCETLIRGELMGLPGIKEVKINHKTNKVELDTDDSFNFEQVKDKVSELGYQASLEANGLNNKKVGATPMQWFYSLLILVAMLLVYKILKFFGFLDWLSVDTTDISLSVALLVGVVASLSSCLAVVGGVVVSFAAKYESRGGFYQASVRPHLLFHAGRLATFFVLGGILGVIGKWFNFSGVGVGWFTAAVAVVMLLLGLNILGLMPAPSAFGLRLPRKTTEVWEKLKKSEHALAPLVLGGFTFFLPCGFTQSMQLFAIASGSFWAGAGSLFLFALGTAPVLIGLGVATSRFKNMKLIVFQKVAGFLVLIFAFYTMTAGLALAGVNIDFGLNKNFGATVAQGNQQVVNMELNYQGYSPNVFTIEQGVPVKWVINVKEMSGCTNEIIVPSLGIKKSLQMGENIIEFTPQDAGDLSFSCWMGMVRGKFVVKATNDISTASLGEVEALQDNFLDSGSSCGADGAGCGCGAAVY